jgi:hypothetical protein
MNHVMLDLETMGTTHTAVVVAIGACYFHPPTGEIGEKFYVTLGDWDTQVKAGCTMDADTVAWWLGAKESSPNQDARNALFTQSVDTISGLFQFMDFIRDFDNVKMWGNGVDFDNVILRNLYTAMVHQVNGPFGLKAPWKYPNSRCFRTLKNEFPVDKPLDTGAIRHHALDDAVYQAIWANKIYRSLIG